MLHVYLNENETLHYTLATLYNNGNNTGNNNIDNHSKGKIAKVHT